MNPLEMVFVVYCKALHRSKGLGLPQLSTVDRILLALVENYGRVLSLQFH